MRRLEGIALAAAMILLLGAWALVAVSAAPQRRISILYDAFGATPALEKDWGYSALVEYDGKRILFDTGNDPDVFARNVRSAGADLSRLDFVVLSHRHLDHTAGLAHLLQVNPNVRIYAPKEAFGGFGSSLPSTFYRKEESLPPEMRYFDGHPDEHMTFGTVWPTGRFVLVDSTVEVAPGIHLIALVSDVVGTKELRELSLAIETPRGVVVVAGCAHPGIDRIVGAAARIDGRVNMVFGGFHLPAAADGEIARIAAALHDTYRVERVAPGHCTGEPAFHLFKRRWKERYTYAGVGSVIDLP